ncbi:unnamed protein product [Owenia fusiformis]|uniref:VWFA domain-containing protein n=1 Tax=Owenia fusiformis TaxID=6347 RepID=A0A8S4NAB7_OWEFU|nr:unnamed protein product [Owenia fusiformis]
MRMVNSRKGIYILWIWLLSCTRIAMATCLNGKPPFSHQGVRFCPYDYHGCCTFGQIYVIHQRLNQMNRGFVNMGLGENDCTHWIMNLLCMECSPFAYELLKLQNPGASIPRTEPREFADPISAMCTKDCVQMLDECPAIKMMQTFVTQTQAQKMTSKQLCKSVEKRRHSTTTTTYKQMCYPDLVSDPWKAQSPETTDRNDPDCFCVEDIITSGIEQVVFLIPSTDNSGRVFFGEQKGKVNIIKNPGKDNTISVFLDIEHLVYNGGEHGLLGMDFHPDFQNNGRFYVYYSVLATVTTSNRIPDSRISEFRTFPNNKDVADISTERVILNIPQPGYNHQGGQLSFGKDGYLYLFCGDGGPGNDPNRFGLDRSVLYGKILRIDVSNTSVPYTIPDDNPFVGEAGVREEIYAYGLRNPWRGDFDTGNRQTGEHEGRVFIIDVGQRFWEEVNILVKGGNYGWSEREGYACFKGRCDGPREGSELFPIFAYGHEEGLSITGVQLYRGLSSPNYEGFLLLADLAFIGRGQKFQRKLWKVTDPGVEGNWTDYKRIGLCDVSVCDPHLGYSDNPIPGSILSFGKDGNVCGLDIVIAIDVSCHKASSYAAAVLQDFVLPLAKELRSGSRLTVMSFHKKTKTMLQLTVGSRTSPMDLIAALRALKLKGIKTCKRNLKTVLKTVKRTIGEQGRDKTIVIIATNDNSKDLNIKDLANKAKVLKKKSSIMILSSSFAHSPKSVLEQIASEPQASENGSSMWEPLIILDPSSSGLIGVGPRIVGGLYRKHCLLYFHI